MNDHEISAFWQEMTSRWVLSEALFFVASNRIADLIGDGPTDLATIAEKTGTRPEMMRRLLNAIAAHGIFKREGNDRFGPTPLSNPLRSDAPESERAYLALGHIMMHPAWGAFAETMRTGTPAFELQFGAPSFEYMKQHPQMAAAFAEGMTSTTKRVEAALVAAEPFGDFKTVIDVGGSFGSLLRVLLTQRPDAEGIIFDRPEIVAEAARRLAGSPEARRLTTIGGSFFESVPAGGDLYLLKQILHDWPDDECLTILGTIRESLSTTARLAVVERVLPDDGGPHPGWMYDMLMMTMTGGKERTAAEYRKLIEGAGLKLQRIIPTGSPLSVIEVVKG
jgi:hypothetical protein